MKEIRKDLKNYEWKYQISNLGRVKSLNYHNTYKEWILSPKDNTHWYKFVWLSKNNKVKNIKIHRLVAEAFLGNPYKKPQVNHVDGIRSNNVLSNLERATGSENMRHAIDILWYVPRFKLLSVKT